MAMECEKDRVEKDIVINLKYITIQEVWLNLLSTDLNFNTHKQVVQQSIFDPSLNYFLFSSFFFYWGPSEKIIQ